jgi:O-methyltransferase
MAKRLAHHGLDRLVWMFDSFEGLPEPSEIDGPKAAAWSKDVTSPRYHDNCSADFDEVRAHAARLALSDRVRIVKGWFDETLPASRDEIGKIALLRIDGDWYDSVQTSLETLFDEVSPGGFVIVDDYYDWDGASRAVHDFLSSRRSAMRIHTTSGRLPCVYMRAPL